MKQKRHVAMVLILTLCIVFSNFIIANGYYDPSTKMKSLGILDVGGRGSSIITRGELVKAVVIASGNGDNASSSVGSTIFSDIQSGSELSGFVNTAISKGIMTGMADGKFHPEADVTFAQMCTILVRALGYTDKDLTGTWPKNYISKAKGLGITDSVNLGNNDGVPMWAAAAMIDRTLSTSVKADNAGAAVQTLLEKSGLSNDSYQFANISSPVYSRPEVAEGITSTSTKIGSIDLTGNPLIIKNGEPISINDIEDNDVVYQVSDSWNTKRYILVVDNKIQGKITEISPSQITIDGKNYTYGQSVDYNNALNSYDNLKVDDYATVLLGYDGKVVDFFDTGHQDNSSYALLINYWQESSKYKVKLLMIDGNTREFYVDTYPGGYKGNLVTFYKKDYETVSISNISYSSTSEHTVDKSLRKIDGYYVSHNIRIFDVTNLNSGNDSDAVAKVMDWSDMPSGKIESGKILYINKVGSYSDINLLVTSDLLQKKYKTGIVKSISPITSRILTGVDGAGNPVYGDITTGYNYTIVVDGADKTWKSVTNSYSSGSILNVEMVNNTINSIGGAKSIGDSGYKFDAADINRVSLNNKSYYVNSDAVVYFISSNGSYTLKSIKDIEAGKTYSSISIYFDKNVSDGGKVDAIIIHQ